MTRRSTTRGLRTIDVDLVDRSEFSRRYLDECPHGGLLVELPQVMGEGELVELDICFLDADNRHRIRGVVLWSRVGAGGTSQAGVGFLPTETGVREALLASPAPAEACLDLELTRKQRRYATTLKVTYQTPTDFVVDYTRNISTGGLFINSERPPALGSSILFQLHPPGEKTSIDLPGEVAWRRPGRGFGVRFSQADEQTLERLSNLVKHLSVGMDARVEAPIVEEITS